jgi:acetylglutamate kinase
VLVKVGGAQLEEPATRDELVRSVALAQAADLEVVLVHGGGNQIRTLVRRLGLPENYHEGLRVTDAETAAVVLQVLAGTVGKTLAAAFEKQGVHAVSLCGADGSIFSAVPEIRAGVDLGFVGAVGRTDRRLIDHLLAEDYLPLIATVAPAADGADQSFYNVNADMAAGPLARALDCQALLFLTDVPGVLDADGRLIPTLSAEQCAELRASGVLRGGMIPKVEAALAAVAENPEALVKIAPAARENAVLSALDAGVGTRFTNVVTALEEAWTSTSF